MNIFLKPKIYLAAFALLMLGSFFFFSNPAQAADGLSNGLVGHWTFDGADMVNNVADTSGQGNNGAMIGFTSTSTAQVPGKIGQALKFNGSTSYVKIPNIAPSVFTATMWFKPSGTQSFYNYSPALMGSYDADLGDSGFEIAPYDPNNSLACFVKTNAGVKSALMSSFIPKNQWTFVACIFNGTSVNMYINSTLYAGTPFAATTLDNDPANYLKIGNTYDSNGYFQGTLDDVRIYNRALSASEVLRLYNLGGTKINLPTNFLKTNLGLVGWWTFDGKDMINNVTDMSGNGNNGAMMGFTSTSTAQVQGKIGQALKFNGVNNYVNVASSTSLNITGSITMSAWIKPSVGTGQQGIFGSANSVNDGYVLYVRHVADSDIGCRINPNGTYHSIAGVGKINYGQWSHIVCMWNDSTSLLSIYLNGVKVPFGQTNTTATRNFGNVYLGYTPGISAPAYFTGSLDDVRIYNTALSTTTINQLYNLGKAKFATSPSYGTTTCSSGLACGLVGYWTFDGKDMINNVTDMSGRGNNGYLVGFTSTSTAQVAGKIGQGLGFNGSTSYINAGATSAMNGLTKYSVSAWVYLNNNGTDPVGSCAGRDQIVQRGSSNSYDGWFYMALDQWSPFFHFVFDVDNAVYAHIQAFSPTISKVSGAWHHVVGVADTTTVTVYLDGVAGTPVTYDGSYPLWTGGTAYNNRLNIGACTYTSETVSGVMNGKIDDVRVYSRALKASEVRQLYNLGR